MRSSSLLETDQKQKGMKKSEEQTIRPFAAQISKVAAHQQRTVSRAADGQLEKVP